ncbi:RING finger protein nhl-1-like isoform X2 [Clytia hemisphaerica]|uniref:Uncharacterized protein n=1 Tax=Clytia hemisphaerica TaxID=252671 RepID=A0A7M5V0Y6_9CNID
MFLIDYKVKKRQKSRIRRQRAMDSSEDDGYFWVHSEAEIVKNYKQVKHLKMYGTHGKKPGQFLDPMGISTMDGFVCVTDPMKNSLTVFNESTIRSQSKGDIMIAADIKPLKECYFSSVFDVAVHESSKNVLVSDPVKKCIHCVSLGDDIRKNNTIFDSNITVSKCDTLSGICVTQNGLIGALDSESGRVLVCDGHGDIKHSFGSEGSDKGQFCLPQFIHWDNLNQRFIVSDTANARVQLFTADGQFLFSFGEFGFKDGGCFKYPSGITTDDHGRIFVVDQGLHEVQIFDKDGHWLHSLGKAGIMPGCFNSPKSLSLFSNGDLVVTDSLNSRLQVFG